MRLEGGRAAACQEYPEAFCRAIVEGLKREIADETWIKTVYESLDATDTIETLMSLCKEPEHAVPPEESLEMAEYMAIYSDLEFVDDVTGVKLDKKEAVNKVQNLTTPPPHHTTGRKPKRSSKSRPSTKCKTFYRKLCGVTGSTMRSGTSHLCT